MHPPSLSPLLAVCTKALNDLTPKRLEEMSHEMPWRTFGPNSDQPCKVRYLADLETDHLQNILVTQKHISMMYSKVIMYLIEKRLTDTRTEWEKSFDHDIIARYEERCKLLEKKIEQLESNRPVPGHEMRSEAWYAVWEQLLKSMPSSKNRINSSGQEDALAEIKRLQRLAQANPLRRWPLHLGGGPRK